MRASTIRGCITVLAGLLLGACGDDPGLPPTIGSFPTGPGRHSVRLTVGGVERELWTYLPETLAAGRPLLLVFHETDGSADDALESSGARALADAQGLAVVAPQARAMPAGDWDNHVAGQRFFETHPNASPSSNNDLLLVQASIAEAQRVHASDPKRVYTIGFSNGAFFAIFAALTLSGQIAAFAEEGGGLVTCPTTRGCSFSASSGSSCEELASQPGYCSCTDVEKPASLASAGRKPGGYLSHGVGDTTVSVFYTCNLAGRMAQLGFPSSLALHPGDHHLSPDFASAAWPFLSQHAVP